MITNHLPAIMAQQGVSIRELSRVTGITYTTIRAMYHGQRRSVQLEVLDAVCEALGVQPGDIYRREISGPAISETLSERSISTPQAQIRPRSRRASPKDAGRDWRSW